MERTDKRQKWLLEEKYGGKTSPQYEADVARLHEGEPLDYIIGKTNFLGCTIDLQKRPLIPRTETEYWTEKVIKEVLRKDERPLKILDIFSGSGCIGIAIAKYVPYASVTLSDISPHNIEQIKTNIALNRINEKRMTVIRSDMFEHIEGTFDYIFANPPYIAENRTEQVGRSVLDYEPHEALFASNNGLFYIKRLLKETPLHLKPGGCMFIEFDSWQKDILNVFLDALRPVYTKRVWHDDQYEKPRMLEVRAP